MCYGDYDPMVRVLPVDNLVWKVAHEVIVMPVVAPRKPLRIRGDRLERLIEFGVEAAQPPERFARRTTSGHPHTRPQQQNRRQDQSSSPALRRRVGAPPTRAKQSFGRRRKPGCVVEPRQSIHRWAVASRRQRRMPTERESVVRVPRPAVCGPHREFPVSWSCFYFTSLARPMESMSVAARYRSERP